MKGPSISGSGSGAFPYQLSKSLVKTDNFNSLGLIIQVVWFKNILAYLGILALLSCSDSIPKGKIVTIHHQPVDQVQIALQTMLAPDYQVSTVGNKLLISPSPDESLGLDELIAELDLPPTNFSLNIRPLVKGISTRASKNEIASFVLQEGQPLIMEQQGYKYIPSLFGVDQIQTESEKLHVNLKSQSSSLVTIEWFTLNQGGRLAFNDQKLGGNQKYSLVTKSKTLTTSIPLNQWTPLSRNLSPKNVKRFSTKQKALEYEIFLSKIE